MIDMKRVLILADMVAEQARIQGDQPSIIDGGKPLTFAEVDRLFSRAANGLAAHGARPGDGVAILMGNCAEFVHLFYGAPRAGFYTVPVNAGLKGDALRYILTHSEVKFLVVDDTLYPAVAELADVIDKFRKVFVRSTKGSALPERTVDLRQLFEAPADKPVHTPDPEALTYLMYTSGTTGLPKAVAMRTRSRAAHAHIGSLSALMVKPGDVLYTCLPLFHANALLMTFGWGFCAGVPVVLEEKFSASRMWQSIRRRGVTQFNAVGAVIPILLKQPESPNDGDNPVRAVNSAACPKYLWEAFEKRFGVKVLESYSSVDGGGACTFNDGTSPVGSVGRPMPGIEWKLVDDGGKPVAPGHTGELLFRIDHEHVMPIEYFKNPEASAARNEGGWLHTGDLFCVVGDNCLEFVDRKSDSMRRRGENISSVELETIITKHPGVDECAAFGVPSEMGENEVMIWVKPRQGIALDLQDLMRHCAERMAFFMVPRFVDVVDDFPRTATTMRVMKAEMKKRGVTERTWDREKMMPQLRSA